MFETSRLQLTPLPDPWALLELIKPITWFPPIWAFLCGCVSVGVWSSGQLSLVVLGMVLAGPIVCGMSQAANDWCDREIDAINEPGRPIPSGRVPSQWGLAVAVVMSGLSLAVGWQLGMWGFGATVVAVIAAWIYSVEPIRLKRSGWWGPGLVGISYETLPWITGAAVMSGGAPRPEIILVALLYGLGAHGIMTLNDFKALEGDRQLGVRSLPVTLGPERAAQVACVGMLVPQLVVFALLLLWSLPLYALGLSALVIGQLAAMRIMLRDPRAKAPWYNATGVLLYVMGMMLTATAISGLGG